MTRRWQLFRIHLANGAGLVLAWQLSMLGLYPISGGVANTSPIYSKVAKIAIMGTLTTANTTKTGAAGTISTQFIADATNGSRIEKLVFQPIGTNVATVARIFVNNGGTTTTAANNTYYRDVTIPAATISEVASIFAVELVLDLSLPPAYTVFVTIATAVAAGIAITGVGGDY